jgi:hypothetical protein
MSESTAEALARYWGLRSEQVVLTPDVPVGSALFVQSGVFPARVLPNRKDRRSKGGEGHGR